MGFHRWILKTFNLFQEIDNDPNLNAAVEIEDHENGSEVDLEEKPQNIVELEIGGEGSPFLLRLIHMKQAEMIKMLAR